MSRELIDRLHAESENYGLHDDVRALLREAIEAIAVPGVDIDDAMIERAALAEINGKSMFPIQFLAPSEKARIRRMIEAAALSDAAPEGEKAESGVPQVLRDAYAEALRWSPKSFAGADAVRKFQTLAGDYVCRLLDDTQQPAPSTPPADAGCVAALQAWVAEQLSSAESHWIDTLQERWEDGDDVPDREHFVSLWIAERLPAAPAAQAKEA